MKTQYIKKIKTVTYYYSDDVMTVLHREDGPTYEAVGGSKLWYKDGLLHREDGPAYEAADGSKYWYLNGLLHREDGPAYEAVDGSKLWYVNDVQYSETEYNVKLNSHDGKVVVVDGVEYELKLKS